MTTGSTQQRPTRVPFHGPFLGCSGVAADEPLVCSARPVDADAGFDLWRTRNGVDWTEITRVGFGNPRNFGGESMVATPIGLFIGTVCVPELRRFVPDATSGCEVWLGRSD